MHAGRVGPARGSLKTCLAYQKARSTHTTARTSAAAASPLPQYTTVFTRPLTCGRGGGMAHQVVYDLHDKMYSVPPALDTPGMSANSVCKPLLACHQDMACVSGPADGAQFSAWPLHSVPQDTAASLRLLLAGPRPLARLTWGSDLTSVPNFSLWVNTQVVSEWLTMYSIACSPSESYSGTQYRFCRLQACGKPGRGAQRPDQPRWLGRVAEGGGPQQAAPSKWRTSRHHWFASW